MFAPGLCASAAVVDVSVVNNSFIPASVTINAGDEVRWVWSADTGTTPHTTTSDTPGLWDSGIHTQPYSFSHTFNSAGSFPYRCTLHAAIGMVGTVTVQPSTADQPPVITTQPASQTVNAGANVLLTVVATGTPPLSYQWSKDGMTIANATASSLRLNPVSVR